MEPLNILRPRLSLKPVKPMIGQCPIFSLFGRRNKTYNKTKPISVIVLTSVGGGGEAAFIAMHWIIWIRRKGDSTCVAAANELVHLETVFPCHSDRLLCEVIDLFITHMKHCILQQRFCSDIKLKHIVDSFGSFPCLARGIGKASTDLAMIGRVIFQKVSLT